MGCETKMERTLQRIDMGITKSRRVSREAPMKGIKAIGIAPYLDTDLIVNTVTGVVDLPNSMTTPAAIARFELRATGNNFVETGTFDEATRTNEYVGVNTFFIPGNDDELRTQLDGNAGLLKVVFIEDFNGKVRVVGSQNGCDIMTVVGGTDTQGFTVTVNSKELDLAYSLTAAAITEYRASIIAY